MGPAFTSPLKPLCFPSPCLVDPSRCLYFAFSLSVGWVFSVDSPFYILPTLRPRYLNPRRPARHSGGPQHQPVGSRPCFASFRSFSFPFCVRPCTALREDTRRRKWRRSFIVAYGPRLFVLIFVVL